MVVNVKTEEKAFGELFIGEVFITTSNYFDDGIFMKIHYFKGEDKKWYNAVELRDGRLFNFGYDDVMVPAARAELNVTF